MDDWEGTNSSEAGEQKLGRPPPESSHGGSKTTGADGSWQYHRMVPFIIFSATEWGGNLARARSRGRTWVKLCLLYMT